MKHAILALILMIVATNNLAAQSSNLTGMTAELVSKNYRSVGVKNPDGIYIELKAERGGDHLPGRFLKFDDNCRVDYYGNPSKVTAIIEKEARLLVSYTIGGDTGNANIYCPTGTLFWMDKAEFLDLKSIDKRGFSVSQVLEMEEIRRLLKESKK